MRHVVLHIGLHKTGTTSLQTLLWDNADSLADRGIYPYPFKESLKLATACVREECADIPAAYAERDWLDRRAELYDECRGEIEAFLDRAPIGKAVISCEHLSYFRTEEECARLKSLFPEPIRFEIYLVLRDKAAFLESYRNQTIKSVRNRLTYRATSPYYCLPGSWLTDFERLQAVYTAQFGQVTTFDYDPRDSMGQILAALGAPDVGKAEVVRLNARRTDWNVKAVDLLYRAGLLDSARRLKRLFSKR